MNLRYHKPHLISRESVASRYSVFLFISTLSGRATDAGLARPVVALGGLLLVIGTFMTSLAVEYWQIFLAQGLCIGIGQGLMWLPTVTLISTYFVTPKTGKSTLATPGFCG